MEYLKEDNTFRSELDTTEAFAEYTARATSLEDVKTVQEVEQMEQKGLDEEDNAIKYDILKTLTEINKNYRIMGTRHLVENALQGINLDSELEYLINKEILTAFPDSKEMNNERGVGA